LVFSPNKINPILALSLAIKRISYWALYRPFSNRKRKKNFSKQNFPFKDNSPFFLCLRVILAIVIIMRNFIFVFS
jgi:hypothetical protein